MSNNIYKSNKVGFKPGTFFYSKYAGEPRLYVAMDCDNQFWNAYLQIDPDPNIQPKIFLCPYTSNIEHSGKVIESCDLRMLFKNGELHHKLRIAENAIQAENPANTSIAPKEVNIDKKTKLSVKKITKLPSEEVSTLSVKSVPAGRVFLDEMLFGETPIVRKTVAPGKYHMTIETYALRREYSRDIEILPGRPYTFDLDLYTLMSGSHSSR